MESKATKVIFGKIYTGDAAGSVAEAVAISDNKIIFVGSKQDAEAFISRETQVITTKEDFLVLPGFIETHLHPLIGNLRNFSLLFSDPYEEPFATPESFKRELKAYHEANKDLAMIIGFRFGFEHFPDNRPNRYVLDQVCQELGIDKPVFLMRYDYHCLLLNTQALNLCGITRDTVYPPKDIDITDKYEGDHLTGLLPESCSRGARLEKGEDGEPTGNLLDGAMMLARKFVPKDTFQTLEQALNNGIEQMLSEGITTFMDAAVRPYFFGPYKKNYCSGNLSKLPRCNLSVVFSNDILNKVSDPANKDKKLSEMLGFIENDKLSVETAKFFADGERPCLCCNYHGGEDPDLFYTTKDLSRYFEILHLRGIRCHTHVLGSGAVKAVLDAFEYVKEKHPDSFDPRHYTAHSWLVEKEDIKRYAKYNITANFTPYWFFYPIDVWPFKEDVQHVVQYAVKDFFKEKVNVVFGSDWPVTTMRPLDNIEVGMTRKPLGMKEAKGDHEEHSMSIKEALNGYHKAAAWLFRRENELGSIEVGKKADMIILDKDITECDPTEIHQAKVILTLIDGEVAWELKA